MTSVNSLVTTATNNPYSEGNTTPSDQVMNAVSQLFGITGDQLQTDLSSGQSLASIAKTKGVPSQQLVQTVAGALQSANPNLSSAQASNIATNITQRVGGGHHHRRAGGGGAAPATSSATATPVSASSASSLSTLLSDSTPSATSSSRPTSQGIDLLM
jgi:TctA family transporter